MRVPDFDEVLGVFGARARTVGLECLIYGGGKEMDGAEEPTVALTQEEAETLERRVKELGTAPLLVKDVQDLHMPRLQPSWGQLEFCQGGRSWVLTMELDELKTLEEAVAVMIRKIEEPGPGVLYCRRILYNRTPIRERRIDGR